MRPEEAELNPTDPAAATASSPDEATESKRRAPWKFVAGHLRRLRRKAPPGPPAILPEGQLRQARRVRIGSGIIMVLLAAGAAVVSYNDGLYLVRLAGIHGRVAYLYPLLPDGLIIISWSSVYEAGLAQLRKRPGWATAGIALGACLTLGMNIGAGVLHNRLQALVDGVVPVVLFVALEILVGLIRRGHGTAVEPDDSEGLVCLHGVAASIDEAVRTAWFHARECLGEKPTFIEFEARFGVSRKRVAELVRGPAPQAPVPSLNGSAASV
jgi:hypothetical protein